MAFRPQHIGGLVPSKCCFEDIANSNDAGGLSTPEPFSLLASQHGMHAGKCHAGVSHTTMFNGEAQACTADCGEPCAD